MIIKRHYLVDITEKGRLSAYEQLKTYDPSKTNHLVKTLILEGMMDPGAGYYEACRRHCV